MQLRTQWILIYFAIEVSRVGYSILKKMIIFLVFSVTRVIFTTFLVCKSVAYILELHKMIRVSHVLACSMGFKLLCDRA